MNCNQQLRPSSISWQTSNCYIRMALGLWGGGLSPIVKLVHNFCHFTFFSVQKSILKLLCLATEQEILPNRLGRSWWCLLCLGWLSSGGRVWGSPCLWAADTWSSGNSTWPVYLLVADLLWKLSYACYLFLSPTHTKPNPSWSDEMMVAYNLAWPPRQHDRHPKIGNVDWQ